MTLPDWRPIETAPRDGRRFLAALHGSGGWPDCVQFIRRSRKDTCWLLDDSGERLPDAWVPTHWMPEPPLPKARP